MLTLAHALLLWSAEARLQRHSSTHRYLVLGMSLLVCAAAYVLLPHSTMNGVTVVLSFAYAALSRSWWPLTLVPLTWDLGHAYQHGADYYLQSVYAVVTSWLLDAPLRDTTLEWYGVSVHVGPSCANLMMFQGAAMLAWLVTPNSKPNELARNILVFILLGGVLNLFRILALTLAAPLAPSEAVWLWIHDGVSLGCSMIAIAYLIRRIQRSSANAPAKKSPQTTIQ